MADRQQWLNQVKSLIRESPLVSNAAFGFIQTGLEKLVEMEFQCPCKPTWNALFSSGFFIIPAVMAFTLMLLIEKRRCDEWRRIIVSSSVPAIVWLILLFFDGRYFACAMSTWEGIFVVDDKEAKIKWCKPNVTSDKEHTTKNFYSFSQGIGECLLLVICVGLIVYVSQERCCGSGGIQGEGDRPGEGDRRPGGDRPGEGDRRPGGDRPGEECPVEMHLLPSTT